RDVILKANVDDILRPQDEKKASFMTYSILKGNRAQEARKFTRNDGSSLWAELNALSFRLNGDDYIVAHVRDITEKKRSEAEKRKLEAQLRQAQKMEALGTLAGGIAHDFNNLLMVIQGRVSLMCLVITADDPDYEHLMSIQEMVRRAAGLTSQLLGFARGGKYEVKPTDLNGVIQKSSQMFGRTKKEITIRCLFQKNIWTVEVDQGQIDQVLLNIYVNAWQAMPEGGELFIQTENITFDENYEGLFKITPGNYVKITIADTGEGMDQETQKRIFEPFFTTKARGTGTGLGLASVYGIIKNHGGFIDVSSEKGKGTRFYIYLPALEKEIQEEEEFSTKVLKGKESILLVDDEEMVAKVNEELLRILGYEVMVANSGKEALEIYRYHQKQIDMIILDMIMPDMSGSETYDHLKELNPDVKVLLSSGYSVDGQASDILKRGCKGFIQKPFTVMQLSQKLRLAMGDIPTSSEQYHLSFSTQARNYHATL
ncbi:MAG: response regulator, partial [Deltaproteobacteria bacterium]|nr:response regulator [Deltaproteobacteria bacterium]